MITDTARKAAALYKAAAALMDEAATLLNGEGIKVYTGIKSEYMDVMEPSIFLGRGIKKLTDDESEIKPKPPMFNDKGFESDDTIGWINVDGVNFYQYKECTPDKMELV